MDSLDRDAQETCPPTRLDALRPAPLAPPPPPEHQTAWTDEARNDAGAPSCCALTARHQVWSSPVSLETRVYCNRALNMRGVTAVRRCPLPPAPPRL